MYKNNSGDNVMEKKLQEIIQQTNAGQFIWINEYQNKYGEVSNYLVHADANYESVHKRSLKKLEELRKDKDLVIDITRYAWVDSDGNEHTRKANGRTQKKIEEQIKQGDVDLIAAFDKVENSIKNPREVTTEYIGSNSAFELNGECYLRNVLIEKKDVIKKGDYPISCQARINAICDWIKSQLPIGQYRQFTLSSTNCKSLSASGEAFIF